MALRRALAVTLIATLALPAWVPAAEPGTLRGTVSTVDGSRVSDAELDLVNLDTGKLTRVRTDANGAFEARLEAGSYKIELLGNHVMVRGPRTVALVAGDTTPADIVVANPAAAAGGGQEAAGPAGTPKRGGDVLALVLFSGALAGAAVYAATRDRKPPTTSGSR